MLSASARARDFRVEGRTETKGGKRKRKEPGRTKRSKTLGGRNDEMRGENENQLVVVAPGPVEERASQQ